MSQEEITISARALGIKPLEASKLEQLCIAQDHSRRVVALSALLRRGRVSGTITRRRWIDNEAFLRYLEGRQS